MLHYNITMHINNLQLKPVTIITLFCLQLLFYSCKCVLIIDNLTISTQTNYTVVLAQFFTTATAGSMVQLQLPQLLYSADDLHSDAPYIGNVFSGYCPVDCSTVAVSYSGYIINITGMFPVDQTMDLQYTITGIRNPRSAVSATFIIRVLDVTNNVLFTQNVPVVTFAPKVIPCSAVATDFTAIGFVSTAYLTIQPVSNPSDQPLTFISVQFPTSTSWAGQTIQTSTLTADIYCISNTQPAIICQRSGQVLTVSGSTYSSNIDLQVHSISNPTSMMAAGPVVISTLTSARVKLDSCTININNFTQDYLRAPSMTVTYNSDTLLTFRISVIFPARVAAGTTVSFTLPASLPLASASCSTYLGIFQLTSVVPSYTLGTNTMTISPFSSLILKPNIQFECSNVPRPRSASVLPNITVSSAYNGFFVAGTTCCSVVLLSRNSLIVNSIITDKPYLQMSNAQYIISLTTTISLITTDIIMVYFPLQYTIPIGAISCGITSPSASVSTPNCIVLVGNVVKFSSILLSNAVAGTQFTLTISGIQNPVVNPSSSPFKVYTLTSNLQIIQSNLTQTVTISAALITTFSITAGVPLQTLYTPAQYTLQFTTNGLIKKGFYIIVKLAAEIGVNQAKLACLIQTNSYGCWYIAATNYIRVRITDDISSNSITMVISGLIHPQSLAPTQNTGIQMLDSQSNILQISSPILSTKVTLSTAKAFTIIYSSFYTNPFIASYTNIFEPTTLQIIAICPLKIKNTHQLVITYSQSDILINMAATNSACSTGFVCSFDSVNFKVAVTSLSPSIGSDTIYINITNVIALTRGVNLALTLQSSSGFAVLSSSTTVGSTIPDIIQYNLSQSSHILSYSSDLYLDYSLVSFSALNSTINSTLSRLSYILVNIPAEYTTMLASNIYNYTTINANGTGRITITNVTNPSSQVSSSFYISAFASNGELLAISVNNKQFTLACTLPCRTCLSNSSSTCLSCYTSSVFNIFMATNISYTCVSSCPRFYYLNSSTLTCSLCDASCYQCDYNIGTKCLSCAANLYLHQVDYKCYNLCPTGYYGAANFTCRSCASNCLTCQNQTFCYTCAVGLFLYQSQCIIACPPTTFSSSPTLPLICTNCPFLNCLTCTSLVCLSCQPAFYLVSGQCRASCPLPLYPSISGQCQNCQCATCSNMASNCTSCLSAKPYLYNNYCYATCPSNMYPGAANMCTLCSITCLTCTSTFICTACKEGHALLAQVAGNVSCITSSTCPNSTILTISSSGLSSCLPCTYPCNSCAGSVTFCLTCATGYNIHNNTCVSACVVPFYSINNACVKCIPTCTTCSSSDPYSCTECQSQYFLLNTTCYSSCPSGTYSNQLSKSCISCNPACSACANATNCTSCHNGFFLFNWFCYSSCPTVPVRYYQYNGLCQPCQPQCVSCINSPVECTACSHTDYLFNIVTKQCVFQCTSPYFREARTCVGCQSPCLTCDTTYSSCSSCLDPSYSVYNGTCVSVCPTGYYSNSTTKMCVKCAFPCRMCTENQCLLCQSFAYMYEQSCVLSCPHDMPYEQPGYCSECIGIGFCARCAKSSDTDQQICSKCVYPYVLFEQHCLNSCPTNYTSVQQDNALTCTKSESYLQYLSQLEQYNKPIIYPFLLLLIYVLLALILCALSYRVYRYTYYVGLAVGLLAVFDAIFLYYTLYFVNTRYQGQFVPIATALPFSLLLATLLLNYILLNVVYWIIVLKQTYLQDARYIQWKLRHTVYFWVLAVLSIFIGGPRIHKISYSKFLGYQMFAYRVVSVQKFYYEDILVYCSAIGDTLQLIAVAICVFNVPVGYSGITFIAYQTVAIKAILWVLLLYDLKKPDRGFFIGDQQEAAEQIRNQIEQEIKKQNRLDTENFARLIRTKSAENLKIHKQFQVDVDDFISVYNPEDYEPVPKVQNKRIEKNIYKGKFRKGRKITIEERLKKFVDTIKPMPKIDKKKVNPYLHKLIYWKPPQMKKTKKPSNVLPPSQDSMLALLEKKEQEYKEDLDDIELVDEQKGKKYYVKPRYDQRTFLDDVDETIPNQTVQFFYPSNSIDHSHQKQQSIDFDDLLNRNYAKRKHLQKKQEADPLAYESKRKLHHQPQKKRKNLRSFGEMIMKRDH